MFNYIDYYKKYTIHYTKCYIYEKYDVFYIKLLKQSAIKYIALVFMVLNVY